MQLKAVEYLGIYGTPQNKQVLADVYASTNDPALKRAVLRAYMIAKDKDHLLAAAKSESNVDLRREAIRQLGGLGAHAELAQLYTAEANAGAQDAPSCSRSASKREKTADLLVSMYTAETDKNLKREMLRSLHAQGAAKQLIDLARKETDPAPEAGSGARALHDAHQRGAGLHDGAVEQMRTACLLALAALAAAWAQQPPPIQNGKVETRSAAAGLDSVMRQIVAAAQADPVWIGYKVAAVPGRRQTCWDSNYAGTVHLDGPTEFYILYRARENRVEWIQTFSPDCVIDAGNAAFVWLTDVKPAESIAYLASLAQEPRRGPDGAIGAIAVHAAPEAISTLLDMARTGTTTHMRGQALFWLAQTATPQVSEAAIQEAIAKDPETDVKRRAVSALAQIPHNEGVPLLMQLARAHGNAAVQKQAMFWLGRSKDERATKFFQEILAR